MTQLQAHRDTWPQAKFEVSAIASRSGPRMLHLAFEIHGAIDEIAFPSRLDQPRQEDNLWQHTCLEAFLTTDNTEGYFELNFSPSRAWASYYFDEYRGYASGGGITRPKLNRQRTDRCWKCAIQAEMPKSVAQANWQLNLAAVIEETSGHKSYWALAHPPSGPPDFHDPACFVLELPPAPKSSPRT